MRRSFLVRAPLEYRERLLQEEIARGYSSTLETMNHILSSYFGGNQPHKPENAVTKPETAVAAVTERKPPLVTEEVPAVTTQRQPAVSAPVTEVTQPVADVTAPDEPRTLYGGVIRVT